MQYPTSRILTSALGLFLVLNLQWPERHASSDVNNQTGTGLALLPDDPRLAPLCAHGNNRY